MDATDGRLALKALEALDYAGESPGALEVPRRTSSEALNACRTRLRRARGLVRPGTIGLSTGTEYSRVGSSTWLCPTSFVSTRIGVELVDGLGN